MPAITHQRLFPPTRGLNLSVDFYSRMGGGVRFREANLVLVELGSSHLFLQKYYQEDWANNTVVHLIVDDAALWYETAMRAKSEGGFETVPMHLPRREDYGAHVTYIIDPAGVLLHFAEMDKP